MYVLGGSLTSDGKFTTGSIFEFDSMQGTWSQVEPMPEPRKLHAACAIGSDIYVFGGRFNVSGNKRSVFRFDTETNTWSTLEPMPLPCSVHRVNVLDGHLVYIVGTGEDGKGVLLFDTDSGVWSTLGATSSSKLGSVTFVVSGCLYVAGGEGNKPSSVERYDVATDTWTAMVDMLDGRADFCAVTIASVDPAEEEVLFDSLIAKATKEHNEAEPSAIVFK
jgi:hypothetical protein